jgi:hypothetical protein
MDWTRKVNPVKTVPRMTSTLKGLNHLRANGDATLLGLNLFWVS